MTEQPKTYKRETATVSVALFWCLVGWVAYKDFPEGGNTLVSGISFPVLLMWGSAYGMDWWGKQGPGSKTNAEF